MITRTDTFLILWKVKDKPFFLSKDVNISSQKDWWKNQFNAGTISKLGRGVWKVTDECKQWMEKYVNQLIH